MKKNWRRGIAAGLAGMLIVLAAGCGAAADSAVPEGQEQEMPGTGGTVSADKAGNSAAEIPTPDPEKRYQISYTGLWSGADYEDGSYIETMIEDALNVDITVEKAETNDTIDLLLASGEMPDCGCLIKRWTGCMSRSWQDPYREKWWSIIVPGSWNIMKNFR